jgi:hypothetical protein
MAHRGHIADRDFAGGFLHAPLATDGLAYLPLPSSAEGLMYLEYPEPVVDLRPALARSRHDRAVT